MFIQRKTIKLPNLKNKISNTQMEGESAVDQLRGTQLTHYARNRPQTQVSRFPTFNYLLALILIFAFAYLIYSVNGGPNSIPGFNQKLWWQYILTLIPLTISILLFCCSKIETVSIYKEILTIKQSVLLGFYLWQHKQKELTQLLGISVVKKGLERVMFNNVSYFVVFNFRPCEQIQTLECSSEITANQYLQQLRLALPQQPTSLRNTNARNTLNIKSRKSIKTFKHIEQK